MILTKITEKIINTPLVIWPFRILIILIIAKFALLVCESLFNTKILSFNENETINNETILALLAIVLAFAGVISLFFYKIIDQDVKRKSKEAWQKERDISNADVTISLAYSSMRFYRIIHKERTESEDEEKNAKREIDNALLEIERAIGLLRGIEEIKCQRQLFLTRNNRAYYLSRKWNYYKDKKNDNSFKNYLEENDKNSKKAKEYKEDKRIAEEDILYLKNKKASEVYPDLKISIEDTFAWVAKIFSVDPKIET